MYHEDIFYPFLPIFSTFDGKLVNVVENADCFWWLQDVRCVAMLAAAVWVRTLNHIQHSGR